MFVCLFVCLAEYKVDTFSSDYDDFVDEFGMIMMALLMSLVLN